MEEKLKQLGEVKKLYEERRNIINHLKKSNEDKINTTSDILISYDFQAGSYIQQYNESSDFKDRFCTEMARVINPLGRIDSILEVGVGEATTLGPLIDRLHETPKKVFGFDLSWSRVKYGKNFLEDYHIQEVHLFTGDMFCTPIKDNSIDLVYTVHAIEPNGGREREALMELYRVSKKYIVLLEPAFELVDEKARQRMLEHGYITDLYATAKSLGYNIVDYRLFDVFANPLNQTGLMIIRKEQDDFEGDQMSKKALCCPITKTSVEQIGNAYYSKEGMLAYPILEGIPCLLPQNAIVATHYMDFV